MPEKDENDALTKDGGTQERRGSIKLKRELGLFSAVNLILGVMIGSGIFVSPASALEYSGSVALCLIIWIVSGIISLLGALSFAELGTVVGRSGAEYAYFQEAFGKMHKFWGPLPSFICAWIYVVILRPAEVAIIVMTCAEYAIQPFTSNTDPKWKSYAITLASISILQMTTERNKDSKDALNREIKLVKGRCVDAINAIENAPPEHGATPENIIEKSLCYMEGLKTELQNYHTPITVDDNLLTAQFLDEMLQKKAQLDELVAFNKGVVVDIDKEIERLNKQLSIAEEAKKRLRQSRGVEVTVQHVQKARQHFTHLRSEMYRVIQSVFPDHFEEMRDLLGLLMKAHGSEDPNESKYIKVTEDIYPLIEMLLGMNIVMLNPYDKTEVKLAY